MRVVADPSILYMTLPDHNDGDSYDQYRLDSSVPDAEIVILEHVVPRAHLSLAPYVRQLRSWDAGDFLNKDVPFQAKSELIRLREARNANRP